MGKMFQNASLKPLGQLKPNCPGMIIGRSSVFYADRKSKMAATTGVSSPLTDKIDKWETELKYDKDRLFIMNGLLNGFSIIDVNDETSGYIGPIVFFYYQVNDTGS
jgi:hypothetical protein